MKSHLGMVAMALISTLALAQPGPGMGGDMGAGMGGMQGATPSAGKRDCAQSRDPQRCEARHKAVEACAGKTGVERQQCREDNMPAPDCSKAANPGRCEERQKVREACKGKQGPERRQCMKEQVPRKQAATPATPPAQAK